MEKLTMNDTIKNGNYADKTVAEIAKISGAIFSMIKDGYEFDKGHSGNSYAQSLSLAHVFVSDPDLFQYAHGSLAALVGDEGYHDDRSDVKEFLEKRKTLRKEK